MKSAFEQALDYTFANEGGFSNDKFDHGGATKFGITISELSRWRKRPVSVAEVAAMGVQEAMAIYKAWYWDSMDLDQVVHTGEQMSMFDIGVVMGIGIPPFFAQRICNNHGAHLTEDKHIGPLTIAEINKMVEAVFVRDFSTMSENRFRGIVNANHSQAKFLKGWLNRAHRLLTLANIPDAPQAQKFIKTAMAEGGEKLVRFAHLDLMDVA